jgi:hypothetical protein
MLISYTLKHMGQIRTSRTFDVMFLLVLVGLLLWAAANRVAVGDWVYFLSYHPDAQVTQIADEAGLSQDGRRLFYRTNPTFADLATIQKACDIERLGCIDSKGRSYILDSPGKHDQAIVTATHEMLHLAYRRLSDQQKADIAGLIDQGVAQNAANGINDELADEKTADDRRDEAHSLLGTEYKEVPTDLELYYSKYFTDRSKVLAANAADQSQP